GDTMDNEMHSIESEAPEIITLTDADGNEVEFEFLDLIEYESNQYAVLLPPDENATEVLIMRVENDEDENLEDYIVEEDPSVLEAVFNLFVENCKELLNPED
ncbi:MAG: DUF1292 domain-containing protein, partial [Candidatus Spyradocola sp.]